MIGWNSNLGDAMIKSGKVLVKPFFLFLGVVNLDLVPKY